MTSAEVAFLTAATGAVTTVGNLILFFVAARQMKDVLQTVQGQVEATDKRFEETQKQMKQLIEALVNKTKQ